MIQEIWKEIPGYEGHYQVSNLGRVKSIKFNKEKIMSIHQGNKHGYYTVGLRNGSRKSYLVSRLVAYAFLGLELNNIQKIVDHIDNNPLNNNLCNLQIVNQRENASKKIHQTSSKYIGVSWIKRDSIWYSHIRVNNKKINLGSFNTEEQAHQAYLDALEKYNLENKYSKRKKETI
jgi:hypothetical protein